MEETDYLLLVMRDPTGVTGKIYEYLLSYGKAGAGLLAAGRGGGSHAGRNWWWMVRRPRGWGCDSAPRCARWPQEISTQPSSAPSAMLFSGTSVPALRG